MIVVGVRRPSCASDFILNFIWNVIPCFLGNVVGVQAVACSEFGWQWLAANSGDCLSPFGQVVQFACVPLDSNLGRHYSRNRPMGSRCSCTALAYLLMLTSLGSVWAGCAIGMRPTEFDFGQVLQL